MSDRPTVVIGGGPNGLVAAWRLANAGEQVIVCERRELLGGLAAGEEFHPGFRSIGVLQDSARFRPWIAREIQLGRFGRRKLERSVTHVCSPNESFELVRDSEGLSVSGEGPDSAAVREWSGWIRTVAPVLSGLLDTPPPKLASRAPGDLWGLGMQGLALRRLGRQRMTDLLRVLPMTVADWLRESLHSETLIEGLAVPALLGSWLGPHSAGSAANLLFREAVTSQATAGGPAAVIEALTAACKEAGVEFRLQAEVTKINSGLSGVTGVSLADGSVIETERVLSTCEPKRALGLVERAQLPLRVARGLSGWRTRGSSSQLDLAIEEPLTLDGAPVEHLVVGTGSIDGFEQAFDALKYRQLSDRLLLDVRQPSLHRPELAPAGKHVLSVRVGYTPVDLEGGWDEPTERFLIESVVREIERTTGATLSPVATRLAQPLDLERRFGATGGQIHHGEQGLDQLLFVRPQAHLAHYEAPIPGLYLGGSGSHPGGGLTGVPGWLAAGAILGR